MPCGPENGIAVRLRLIGHMEAWTVERINVLPAGRKARAVLACLALARHGRMSRARLAELLFSGRPDDMARIALRHEIHALVEALASTGTDILHIARDHVALRPGKVWIDVREVERATPDTLPLFDGGLLEDLDDIDPAFDSWLMSEREGLRDRARGIAEGLLAGQTRPEGIVLAARRLLLIDPTREGAWRALIRAWLRLGDRAMAVRTYHECGKTLARCLDVEPSAETRALLFELEAAKPPPEPVGPMTAGAWGRDAPRIAIAPFPAGARLGGIPDLAPDIAQGLDRFGWLRTIHPGEFARWPGPPLDEARVQREARADLLLDGTAQPGGTAGRLTVRLRDLRSGGTVLWAQRFEVPRDASATVREGILARTVVAVEATILAAEEVRNEQDIHDDPRPYELFMRSLTLTHRMERDGFLRAGEYLRRAIEIDPSHAAAPYWYAVWNILLIAQKWAPDPAAAADECRAALCQAMTLAPSSARLLTVAGHLRAALAGDFPTSSSLHDRAIEQNPYLPAAWGLSALSLAYQGALDEAERRFKHYKYLSPFDAQAFMIESGGAMIALLRRDHAAAAAAGRIVTQTKPSYLPGYKPLLAALGHLGRGEEAAAVAGRLLALEPDFTVEQFFARHPLAPQGLRDHYAEGLRRAGLP